MNLKFDISDETIEQMYLFIDERIYYAIPYDLDKDGNWCDDGMCVVSSKNIFVVKNEKPVSMLPVSQCKNTRAEATVEDTNEISVAGLPEGVYVLRITDEKGTAYTERVSVVK